MFDWRSPMKAKDPRLGALAARIKSVIDGFPSIAEASRKIGLPVNSVSRMRRGEHEPGVFDVIDLAAKTGVDLLWLAGLEKGEPKPPEPPRNTVSIDELNIEAAAGAGRFQDQVELVQGIEFPRVFVQKLGLSEKHLKFLRVKGESMAPTISEGALLLLDTREQGHKLPAVRKPSARRKSPPEIYVFNHGDLGYRVKRIETLDDRSAYLVSDNMAEHPPELIDRNSPITIIGRVAWWDNRL